MATAGLCGAIASATYADSDPMATLLARTDAVTKEVVALRGLKLAKKLEWVLDKDKYAKKIRKRLSELSS